jgi:hypothetical protein
MNAWLAKPIPLGMVYCEPGEAFGNTVINAADMVLIVGRLISRQFEPRGVFARQSAATWMPAQLLRRTIELF